MPEIPDAAIDAAIEAAAAAIHDETCRWEDCTLTYGTENEAQARAALTAALPHLFPGLFTTRHDGDLAIWRDDPDRPHHPHALTAEQVAEALARYLPDRTEEE